MYNGTNLPEGEREAVGNAGASGWNPGPIRKGVPVEPISKHEQHARPGEPLEGRPSPARLRENAEPSRRRTPLFAAVTVALSLLATAACGGAGGGNANAGQEPGGQESAPDPETTVSAAPQGDERDTEGARAGEAEARAGDARAGDAEAGGDGARAGEARAGARNAGARAGEAIGGADGAEIAGNSRRDDGGEEGPRKVTLKITGDRGTEFSGACSVGGTESSLDGRVPERYVFEPRGERLGCELRTEGGSLGIVLTDGASVHSEQQTTAGESTVKFTYANGSIWSSTSSVSEGRSVTYSDNSSSEKSR